MNLFQQVLTFFPPVNTDIKDLFQETSTTYKITNSNDPFNEPLPQMTQEQLQNLIFHLQQFRESINSLHISLDTKIEALKNFKDRYSSLNILNSTLVTLITNTVNEYEKNKMKVYQSMVTDHLLEEIAGDDSSQLDRMSILDKAPQVTKKDSQDLTNLMKGFNLSNKCINCGKDKKISKKPYKMKR